MNRGGGEVPGLRRGSVRWEVVGLGREGVLGVTGVQGANSIHIGNLIIKLTNSIYLTQ